MYAANTANANTKNICDVIEGQKYHELVIQLIQDTPILILTAFQGLM